MEKIIVKKSKIHKLGVFANQNFKKGNIVLKWKPKILTKNQVDNLKVSEKKYLIKIKNKNYLMQEPEKFVNHSCEPNTRIKNSSDTASRNILKGEEITSDYTKIKSSDDFKCNCGNKTCQKIIR